MPSNAKVIDLLTKKKRFDPKIGDYHLSKLEIFYFQELAKHIKPREYGQTKVIVNMIDPGPCHSNFLIHRGSFLFRAIKRIFARTSEVGARAVVNDGEIDNFETHGK